MIAWDVLTDREHALNVLWQEHQHQLEKQAQQIAACDPHNWWVELEVEGGLHLFCDSCPAGVDSLVQDGHDSIWGDLRFPAVRIEGGRHNYTSWPCTVPVHVTVEADWAGWETPEIREIVVLLDQRGPANFGP